MADKVSIELIKELRERTGAGVLDIKKALEKTGGDVEEAVEELRKMGAAKAAKKLDRTAKEGLVYAYVHPGNRVGVLVEVNCETDFVARTEDFKNFVHEVALQIAAMRPIAVRREDIPPQVIEKEKEIAREQFKDSGKPEQVVEKIVEGKLQTFFKEKVLLEQDYIRDTSKTVQDLLVDLVAKIGENVVIRRFCRFELGEG